MPNKKDYKKRGEESLIIRNSEDIHTRSGTPSYDFIMPSSTIKDVDSSVYNFFDKVLNIYLEINKENKKVPVIFATGERWALARSKKAIRDSDGKLILPLITVRRTDIDRTPGRSGLPGDYGELIIKKKISSDNPNYKNLINKLNLVHQQNVHTSGSKGINNEGSRRVYANGIMHNGKLIENKNKSDNIYEFYTIDFPDFFNINYEIVFWTQYQSQNNIILETLFKSFDWQDSVKFTTDKGHYYFGLFDTSVTNQSNQDDFSDSERIVKNVITLNVSAYIFGDNENEPVSVRKTISAPQLNMLTFIGSGDSKSYRYNSDKWKREFEDIEELEVTNRKMRGSIRRRNSRSDQSDKIKKGKSSESVWFFDDVEQIDKFFNN